ncbi:hypothetical protein GWN42_07245, partial [candidate division KSB1 bacterium]|nr:hypothetical protein [candidate division KSB1 bacterium]
MDISAHPSTQRKLVSTKYLFSGAAILVYLATVKLLVPFITSSDFGLHRDEFLYMAMGEHLSWGYLEVPPGIAVIAKTSGWLFGKSLAGVRFIPALTGAFTLILTGLIARELSGGRFAQILSALAYLFSLVYLRMNLLFQPVTFDLFCFVLGIYLFTRILKTDKPGYWLLLGAVTGLGLLNKYTMLLFGFGLAVGLLLTPYRRYFRSKWLWISTAVALIIWLPNLIWQHTHGWPFFEHMRVLSERQLANVEPVTFLLVQVLMNLYAAPIWLIGLYFCLISDDGKRYRPIGWMYVAILVALLFLAGKVYYLAPAYPMLFAAGAVAIEKHIRRTMRTWLKPVITGLLVLGSATLIPVGVPLLSVESMIRYFEFGAKYMGLKEALRWETGKFHKLPQDYADMLGWQELVAAVAKTYDSLPPEKREQCAIFASNYGEAGAVDYYHKRYNIPKSISHSGSYWLWGYRDYSG